MLTIRIKSVMSPLVKKCFFYTSTIFLIFACLMQGFFHYHNWKVEQWCKQFGAYYNDVGAPPKVWDWPWNWSMLEYVSISDNSHNANYRLNDSPGPFPYPTLEDVQRLIFHAKFLPRLRFIGIYIPLKFNKEDLINLKNQREVAIHSLVKFSDEEMKFIRNNMPNTVISIKFVE